MIEWSRPALPIAWLGALAACSAAPPPAPPPPKPAPPVALAPKPPPPPTVPAWSPDYDIEERFTDPERVQKLASAFPKIDEAIQRTQTDLKLSGVAVAILVDGRVAHVATAGQRDTSSGAPVTPDSVFRIASVTKTMTAAAILKLRDSGKLSLDEPASKYLPELARVRLPTRDSRPITLRHLLTHSSGLARDVHGSRPRETEVGPTSDTVARLVEGMPVAFAPGSGTYYSNLGFSLLGVVIERVAKTSYRSYLEQSFFRPLGMRSAAWEQSRVPANVFTRSYEMDKAGALAPVEKHSVLGIGDASGGLYLSVSDLGRWVGWQLSAYPPRSDAESGPLARATIREMHDVSGGVSVHVTTPFSTLGDWLAEPWAGGMALGWNATSLCDTEVLIEKSGLLDGYATEVEMFPHEGVGIVMLTNTVRRSALKRRAVFDVLKLLRATGGMQPRVRVSKKVATLDRALGRLLRVLNRWDEAEYTAMLTAQHKLNVPMATEQAELAAYAKLHGRCTSGTILQFNSPEHARYLLQCERGRLELTLSVIDGLIAGFTGFSTQVEADPKALPVAEGALREARFRERFGKCKLGQLKERSGTGWHRFDVACARGKAELVLEVENGGVKADTVDLKRASESACDQLVVKR
jgi:CubicO group peptidase (beta-lactamase class C family)